MDKFTECSRPVECGNCKKTISYVYKEISEELLLCSQMCSECPLLQEKIYGHSSLTPNKTELSEAETSLYCGNCHTSLESIKMGNALGCADCYIIFSDRLITELINTDKIPSRLKKILETKKNHPIHIGKSLHKPATIAPSQSISTLNEALNEALEKENYEQAAWLRDQIKALMENGDDGKH